MKPSIIAAALFAALLSACSPGKSAAPTTAAASPGSAKYDTTLSMAELMGHVVDPASFAYWRGSGTEVTAKGERDLSPTTPEGWELLENGAAILIETGNVLQTPGRVREPVADWNRWSQELSARAVVAKAAAFKHDKKAVFDAGGRLYETCTSCHAQFVIAPALAAEPAPVAPFPADANSTPKK